MDKCSLSARCLRDGNAKITEEGEKEQAAKNRAGSGRAAVVSCTQRMRVIGYGNFCGIYCFSHP